jgi:hypothetical protein
MGRLLPSVAAVALLGGVVITGVAGGLSGDAGNDAASPPPDTAVMSTATTVAPTTSITLAPTTTTIPKTTIDQPLSLGMQGQSVQRLQERLTELGFRPGPADGVYGNLTRMSVWAYEKLVMDVDFRDPSGVVTPQMWLDLQDPLPIRPRRPNDGQHTEIYLEKQSLVVFRNNVPVFISHISSGELAPPGDDFRKGADWAEEVTIDPGEAGNVDGTEPIKKGVIGNSWTPSGVYEFYFKREGNRQSRLGGMLNPVYFNYGIAVHGGYNVPLQPDSHGCIRIPNAISRDFYDLIEIGEKVFVFDGTGEPEDYGSPPGWFDRDDPDYTTTTSTPPPTAPPATTAPPTTRPPTTPPPATQPATTRPATTRPATTAPPPTTAPPTSATTAPPASAPASAPAG